MSQLQNLFVQSMYLNTAFEHLLFGDHLRKDIVLHDQIYLYLFKLQNASVQITKNRNQEKYANIWQINEVYDKDEQDGEEGGGVWKMSLPRTSSMALLAG